MVKKDLGAEYLNVIVIRGQKAMASASEAQYYLFVLLNAEATEQLDHAIFARGKQFLEQAVALGHPEAVQGRRLPAARTAAARYLRHKGNTAIHKRTLNIMAEL